MTRGSRTGTAAWQRLRRKVLDRDGWRCRKCSRPGALEVHHTQPGNDDPDTLLTVCRGCHIEIHRRKLTATEVAWQRHLDGFGPKRER